MVTISAQANNVSGDFELTAKDSQGRVIAAATFLDPIAVMTAVEKLQAEYPAARVNFGC